ncbi:MAG: hypothetical protein PQJ61_07200 [Spirochaetales bacterium]|uniref:Uncharacterized protein n=1 Tax=Candidatus Thalassospirochaeta sargassi TaxID=3119039 RepID=A0AAJ1MMB8_9SPIO|nr:hypothetical protein [Spirochaetales bacterium]
MKTVSRFCILIIISTLFFSACAEPVAPAVDSELLTYSVECSDTSLLADITYLDETNELIKLTDEELPWSVSVEVQDSAFIGVAYLKVEIDSSEVFTSYANDVNTGVSSYKLIDGDADFEASGVEVDDVIYIDPDSLQYTTVDAVDSATTLTLSSDLFEAISTDYFIYEVKTLTATADYNGETLDTVSAESERSLSCLIQESIDL